MALFHGPTLHLVLLCMSCVFLGWVVSQIGDRDDNLLCATLTGVPANDGGTDTFRCICRYDTAPYPNPIDALSEDDSMGLQPVKNGLHSSHQVVTVGLLP